MKKILFVGIFATLVLLTSIWVAESRVTQNGSSVTFSYTADADTALLIRDSFADVYEYQDTIDGQPNPQTKTQFVDEQIKKHIREVVEAHKYRERERELANIPQEEVIIS